MPQSNLFLAQLDRRRLLRATGAFSLVAALRCGPVWAAPTTSVAVSTFGTSGEALQRAIDTGAHEVVVDVALVVRGDVRLRGGQTIRFAGGRIVVPGDARIVKAVLNAEGQAGVRVVAPVIDARAVHTGVTGLRLLDADDAIVEGGHLRRANVVVESYDVTRPRRSRIARILIDMDGFQSTAIYLSGVRGVDVVGAECTRGLEGVGIYNGARQIAVRSVFSHNHIQDGFLVYAGQQVTFTDCRSDSNGQSGFTTQRQSSGSDVQAVRWVRCRADRNGYDGFDLRGASIRPWRVDTGFVLSACRADRNRRCGFYIVMAEGTKLARCIARQNRAQNLFVDTSDDVRVTAFQSVSGAVEVPSGPNKAGILVYNSDTVEIAQAVSSNGFAPTQDFGVAFTGSSTRGRLIGGSWSGNRLHPVFTGPMVAVTSVTR